MTNLPQKSSALETNRRHTHKDPHIFDARSGYDRIADAYDRSPWRRFWRRNEYPVVQKIFFKLFQKYKFANAIDIGSGTGFYSRYIGNYVPTVVGVDISSEMLRVARSNSQCNVFHSDFVEFDSDLKFDFALSARTLSHIADLDRFFASLNSNTRDGSSIVITDIHPNHNYRTTRFDYKNEIIEIETYKHSMTSVFDKILNTMSDAIYYKEYYFSDLKDKWASVEFRSVIGSIDPIFYILAFRKDANFDSQTHRYLKQNLKYNSIKNA